MISVDQMEEKISQALPGSQVVAQDLTGGGDHWRVKVRASQFKDKSMVACHQMIYAALGDWMKEAVHALAIDAAVLEGDDA